MTSPRPASAPTGDPPRSRPPSAVPRFAMRGVGLVAAATAGVLIVLSGRYGYHRDDLKDYG